jgi:hypothetical protein
VRPTLLDDVLAQIAAIRSDIRRLQSSQSGGAHSVGAVGEQPFQNGYQNYQAGSWESCRFYLIDGLVHLGGMVFTTHAPTPGEAIFTLPSDLSPEDDSLWFQPSSSGLARVDVRQTGDVLNVSAFGGNSGATPAGGYWLSLNGIYFRRA